MAIGELFRSSRCLSEEHNWHLCGKFIGENEVTGELDIELGSGSYKLSVIMNLAKKSGVDSWRLSCGRCGHTGMFGCFPSQNEVESVKI